MKKLFVLGLLVANSAFAYDLTVKSPRVIDGDTIDTGYVVFEHTTPIHLRIYGIDTPELHGKCDKEKAKAKEAKEFLKQTVKNEDVGINIISWDKYGGRIVGVPYVLDVPLNEEMIRRGYAVAYTGGKKTMNWCK